MWRRKNKYGAKPTRGFASKLEAAVYDKLVDREVLGEISDIKKQQSVVLVDCDKCGTRINWKVDFSFLETSSGKVVYVEAKGVETSDYRRKLKAWRDRPPASLEIWKGSHRYPKLHERIDG